MMKDRMQKISLVRYFLKRRWYPQMEVVILCDQSLSSTNKQITDVDVLGLCPNSFGKLDEILGDCKTLKNQSPINRILWLKGLLDLTNSKSGIIILTKQIEKDHKLVANKLEISIMSDNDFKNFVDVTTSQLDVFTGALEEIELWEKKATLNSIYPNLSSLYEYINVGFWNEKSVGSRLRRTISAVYKLKNEFNPDKDLHLHLILDIVSLFAICINDLVCTMFNQVLIPDNKNELDNDLKLMLWGGRDTYEYMNDVKKKLLTGSTTDLSLHEWTKFMQLVRSCLDEPFSTSKVPLILKEMSFEYLSDVGRKDTYDFSKKLLNETPQAGRFAIQMIDYFCSATKLPPEFNDILCKRLMVLQRS